MKTINLDKTPLSEALDEASGTIMSGGVVCFPTETFYGLGARYDDAGALERIYEMKRRPSDKAMPLIIGDPVLIEMIAGRVDDMLREVMGRFWPGPLTLLLPAKVGLTAYITAGSGKVAVRMPGRSFALDLARWTELPMTATSANISGMPAADNAVDVIRYFDGAPDLLIDGGHTPGGRPSTIVDYTEGVIRIIREGMITKEEIGRFFPVG